MSQSKKGSIIVFEGCWIEQYSFHGYPGSYDYPGFLRRMNGLGHCVGASLWPKDRFDEKKLFLEITSAIAQMENWMVWVNDLMSFYKEYDDPRDQTSLIKNYVVADRITLHQALEKLTQDTLQSSQQLVAVFSDKDPRMMDTIEPFMHGYVTWHLCDPRYRLSEIYQEAKTRNTDDAIRFCKYYDQAAKVGTIDPSEWATPSVAEIIQKQNEARKVQEEQETQMRADGFHQFETLEKTSEVIRTTEVIQ